LSHQAEKLEIVYHVYKQIWNTSDFCLVFCTFLAYDIQILLLPTYLLVTFPCKHPEYPSGHLNC